MNKKRNIGMSITIPKNIKEEYKLKGKQKTFAVIEIYPDKKYGAKAKIIYCNSIVKLLQDKITNKERKAMVKNMQKYENRKDKDKPVDTSKWIKPDDVSIRDETIKNLFLCEILDKNCRLYNEARGKAEICYSILHSKHPKNPQPLTNYSIDPYFETIIQEMKGEYCKKRNDCVWIKKGKNWRPLKDARKMYKLYKTRCLKNMIEIKEEKW